MTMTRNLLAAASLAICGVALPAHSQVPSRVRVYLAADLAALP